MSRHCKIIVLPEDSSHADLARGFLKERNVSERVCEFNRRWSGRNGNHAAVRHWLCEEVRRQTHRTGSRCGILALIDEDGQGLANRRNEVADELRRTGLASIDPNDGRCLLLPMRNAETWMVWAARWIRAGRPNSPVEPPNYEPVSEFDDYKRFKSPNGDPLPREEMTRAYNVGKIIATLNSVSPPAGTPTALREILRPLNEFLRWARVE